MDLVDIIAKMRIQVPVDFEQRLSTQGTGWLSTIRDTSLSLANIELIALAVFIVIAAIGVRWIAAHPDQFRRFIRRLRERPWLVRIETLYRGWIEFLVCRFNTEGAYGLSFTASLVTLGLSIWVFSSVVHGVVAHQEPTYFNSLILAYFSGHRTGWLNPVIHELRILGNGWVVLSLATAIAVFRVHKTKSWHSLLLLAAIVLGAGFLDYVFSVTVVQRRLFSVEGIVHPIVHAFPSGNTTLSASYAALGYFLAKACRQWQVKVAVW